MFVQFQAFLMKEVLVYFISVRHSKSASLGTLRNCSDHECIFIVRKFTLRFENLYEGKYLINNNVDTFLGRIEFVQWNEPRSNFVDNRLKL